MESTTQSKSGFAGIDFEKDNRSEINRKLAENRNNMLMEAHSRLEEKRKAAVKKQKPRRTGVSKLSNTDTIQRANQVRAKLLAKLSEAHASDMDPRAKNVFTADIMMQINKVDQTIAAIRRRERAIEEERTVSRKDDTPEKRRRRLRDMQKRSISIRRDLLHHRSDGGFDTNIPTMKSARAEIPAALVRIGEGANDKELTEGLIEEPNVDIGL